MQLMNNQGQRRYHRHHSGVSDPWRGEPTIMPAAAEHDLEGRKGGRNQNDPKVVHPGATPLGAQINWVVYVCVHHYRRERPDRNVDVEIPAPTEGLGYPSTKCRADDRCGHHSDAEGRHRERMLL